MKKRVILLRKRRRQAEMIREEIKFRERQEQKR